MSYLDDHLLAAERVIYRARLHPVIFAGPALGALGGAALGIFLYARFAPEPYWYGGLAVAALAVVFGVGPALRYVTSEFAVTDKRVLAKFGLIRRESLETLLTKVEAIGIEQGVLGRLLDYGTVTITGTGGTREALPAIAAPLEFRRRVQAQIVALEERRGGRSAGGGPREERECPHCAEPILAKAKVCKHCGRDVRALR